MVGSPTGEPQAESELPTTNGLAKTTPGCQTCHIRHLLQRDIIPAPTQSLLLLEAGIYVALTVCQGPYAY